ILKIHDDGVGTAGQGLGISVRPVGRYKQEGPRQPQAFMRGLAHAAVPSSGPTRGHAATCHNLSSAACISPAEAPPLKAARRSALAVISSRLSVLPGSPLGSSTRPCKTRPSAVYTVTLPIQRCG